MHILIALIIAFFVIRFLHNKLRIKNKTALYWVGKGIFRLVD